MEFKSGLVQNTHVLVMFCTPAGSSTWRCCCRCY